MKRILGALALVAVLFVAVVGGGIWWFSHGKPKALPEISAYSHGHLTRVGPYRYCEVLNVFACQDAGDAGELPVTARFPVQLSVPPAIGDHPWLLRRFYLDSDGEAVTLFRPEERLAVTIPTVDPQRGRLAGFVVQLVTLVMVGENDSQAVPHAEWSVRTVFNPQQAQAE